MKYEKFNEWIEIRKEDLMETSAETEGYNWTVNPGETYHTSVNTTYVIKARQLTYIKEPTPLFEYLEKKLGSEKRAHAFIQTLNALDQKGLL